MDADARLDEAVGSVAEEAARLLAALGRPAPDGDRFSSPDSEQPPDAPEQEHVHVAMGDAETCSWCPVCRSVTLVRSLSPETLTQVAEVASAAASLLADLAGRHTESDRGTRPPGPERPRTEPIAVDDEEENA